MQREGAIKGHTKLLIFHTKFFSMILFCNIFILTAIFLYTSIRGYICR